jgi:hypothetical protein
MSTAKQQRKTNGQLVQQLVILSILKIPAAQQKNGLRAAFLDQGI